MNWQSRVLVTLVGGIPWMAASGCGAQNTTAARLAGEIDRAERMMQQPSSQNDGAAWWKLGMLYQDAARFGDAERCYVRATALLQLGDPALRANALDSMGTMYVEMGENAKAEPLEKQALALREAGGDSIGEGRSWMHLAMLSLGEQDSSSAVRYAQMAVERLEPSKAHGAGAASPEERMTALIDLALARCAHDGCRGAIEPLKRAHRLATENPDASGFTTGYTEFLLGYAEWKSGHGDQAGRLMKSGIVGIEGQLGWGHPTYISVMTQYESYLEQAGEFTEASAVRTKLSRAEAAQHLKHQVASGTNATIPPSASH
ncbi:MAG TPA: tetratricopeptide repeat protein [Acidobacteriaceae bacterium]|jgi:tetratricopeptide (TPR) repeat protein|nr:tetratricopeptide repeat protein [Acidobacteriaceae bacterium]